MPPKITFEDEDLPQPRHNEAEPSKIVQWIISHSGGIVKNERQANFILIGFVSLAIIVSIFLTFFWGGTEELPPQRVMR